MNIIRTFVSLMFVVIGTLIGVEFGVSRDRAISKAFVTTIVAFICIVREVPLMVRSAANWARGEVAMGVEGNHRRPWMGSL